MEIVNNSVTRLRNKAVTEYPKLVEFLKHNRVGNLAFVGDDGRPNQLPIAYGLVDEKVLLHGSTAAGGLRLVADGRAVSFGVSRTEGLVLARSAFESSMHYSSAVLFGNFKVIADNAEKDLKLQAITEFLFPGRGAELRSNTKKELAATLVLELELTSWSFKVSDGWPEDGESDLELDIWAGVVPIETKFADPIAAPDLRAGLQSPPSYISKWRP
jgi:nitroimidazol reductase NimA-like FMN-containing flavoprotein (pyridoxamine 5'-phosphate oxidase superfamily)